MIEFDPKNIKIVPIDKIRANEWNPKVKDTEEYKKIVNSIQVNGFKQPIIVRSKKDGDTDYEILDGEQRWRACQELGFDKIYIYDAGDVPDDEAKSVTIWMETQVRFSELQLAPLVAELNELKIEMPYSDEEVEDYLNMLKFDFYAPEITYLKVRMTEEDLNAMKKVLTDYMEANNVDEVEAIMTLTEKGVKHYE